MLDPVSIIGIATTAFKGLKAAVEAGRELEDCMGQLSQWAGAIADLDKSDELIKKKKSSLFRSLLPTNGKSVQAQAMEAFAAKRTAQKQREELRQLIQFTTGKHGWDEFMRMETKIRKDRQEALYAEIERREKLKDLFIGAGVGLLAILTAGLAIWLLAVIYGNK
jgi:phage shock protein A